MNCYFLHSSNILLDECMRAKISDFGLARELPELPADKSYLSVTSFRGSRAYAADEYFDAQCSTKLDVFSLAIVTIFFMHY